jgi:hypothetical protein
MRTQVTAVRVVVVLRTVVALAAQAYRVKVMLVAIPLELVGWVRAVAEKVLLV